MNMNIPKLTKATTNLREKQIKTLLGPFLTPGMHFCRDHSLFSVRGGGGRRIFGVALGFQEEWRGYQSSGANNRVQIRDYRELTAN